jgi:predicted dienelactone hydrolase
MLVALGLGFSSAGHMTPHAQSPLFTLPAPTGPSPVGTTSWHLVDESRPESFAVPGVPRQIKVVAWYPAVASPPGTRAPYLREGLPEAKVFADLLRAGSGLDSLADVQTHAFVDLRPAAAPAKLPVILFSHGYTSVPSAHAALVEDLASHGYAVLSIVHPYEATAASLSDGTVVTMVDGEGAVRRELRAVMDEWKNEDAAMASVTRAMDDAERMAALRKYLAGLKNTHAALARWTADTRLVLDRLAKVPADTAGGRLAARLDLEKIGAFGHSMGGVTAGEFCLQDKRCRAALNLDGIPQYGSMIDKPLRKPFLMVYSARQGRAGASDVIYERGASPYYRTDIRDTLHLDFSDMVFWGAAFGERKILGAQKPARTTEITRALVREFFDLHLLEKPSPLLSGKTGLPELTISTFTGAKK